MLQVVGNLYLDIPQAIVYSSPKNSLISILVQGFHYISSFPTSL